MEEEDLPIYNVGQRVGPPRRKVQEVDGESIINEARKKNLLFVLARLRYAANKQKVGSWTGFNILVHEKEISFQIALLTIYQRSIFQLQACQQ